MGLRTKTGYLLGDCEMEPEKEVLPVIRKNSLTHLDGLPVLVNQAILPIGDGPSREVRGDFNMKG